MNWWIVFWSVAVVIWTIIGFRLMYIRGYKTGASKILEIWKRTNKEAEEEV